MATDAALIEPELTPPEREEISHLDYFIARLDEMRGRGLIVDDAFAMVRAESEVKRSAILRNGRYLAAISKAKALSGKYAEEALSWASQAAELDPTRIEAWQMLVSLNWQLERDDEAIACCDRAGALFSSFHGERMRLEAKLAERAERRRQKLEASRRESDLELWLSEAKRALDEKRDADAIELCQRVLEYRPDSINSLAVAAFALQRDGQFEPALAFYERLSRLQPNNETWRRWVATIRARREARPVSAVHDHAPSTSKDQRYPSRSLSDSQVFSFKSFANEFLLEHWQKLILCLAVLLIVVGSTVGLGILLGPLLWSPLGKCTIALLPTSLLALLGAGLVRWGAERAGRMLLVATLILVPIHFMLAGELRLLLEPSLGRLIVLGIDAGLLLGLVRSVSGILAPRAGARFLTLALLLLSAFSAASASGTPVAWNAQFAAFQAPAAVFLLAVLALGMWRWGADEEEHLQFVYISLGLLGFAMSSSVIRTGVYALHLEPPLYAVPVMLTAIALVNAARKLSDYKADPRHVGWLRLGGHALSGVAFALALSRPPIESTLFSGNLCATGLLGFGLYSVTLRKTRQPAFFYLSFASLAVVALGLRPFFAGPLGWLEESVRVALHYPVRLPVQFQAIPLLLVNVALAGLTIKLRQSDQYRPLAPHCHYLGIPLSLAAAGVSATEPLAGTICLPGYALCYLAGALIFGVPWIIYLAIAALSGGVYLGSMLVPGIHLADRALMAAGLAVIYWLVRSVLCRRADRLRYALPWGHGAIGLTLLAAVGATCHVGLSGLNSWGALAALGLVGLLAVLFNREWPSSAWAGLSIVSFVELSICGLALATHQAAVTPSSFAYLLLADAVVTLLLAEALSRRPVSATTHTAPTARFLEVIPFTAVMLTALADGAVATSYPFLGLPGLAFLLGGMVLIATTRIRPVVELYYVALAHVVLGVLLQTTGFLPTMRTEIWAGSMALVSAMIALVLWGASQLMRRAGVSAFYHRPALVSAFVMTLATFSGAIAARWLGRAGYPLATLALGLNVATTMLIAFAALRPELTHAAVFHFVAASYVVLFSQGPADPSNAFMLGLLAVVEAIGCWCVGFACRRAGGEWIRACGRAVDQWSVVLTASAVLLADRSPLVLVLVGVASLLMVKSRDRAEWLYATIAAFVAACYFRWLAAAAAPAWMAFAIVVAFTLWVAGVIVQRVRPAACRRLALQDLPYEYPFFEASLLAGICAIMLRISLVASGHISWGDYGWLPVSLSGLSLLMLKAYPRRQLVHLSLAFLTWAVVAAITPSLTSIGLAALAVMALTIALLVIERAIRPFESSLCRRLGVIDAGYTSVVSNWVICLFGLAATVTTTLLVIELPRAVFDLAFTTSALASVDFWALLATFVLLGVFLVVEGIDPRGWITSEPEHTLVGLHVLGVSILWWLGVDCSPLRSFGLLPPLYYPLATGMAALSTAKVMRRNQRLEGWHEPGWFRDLRSDQFGRLLSYQAVNLSIFALLFTRGAIAPVSAVTLIIVALAVALVSLQWWWVPGAAAAAIAWASGWGLGAWLLAGNTAEPYLRDRATAAAIGLLLAAFSLWSLAGVIRKERFGKKANLDEPAEAGELQQSIPWAVETVALAASVMAGLMVFIGTGNARVHDRLAAAAGIGALLAAGLLQILLVPRWRDERLVYLAHIAMLAAYGRFRATYPLPVASDAVILTLLGFLDLSIGEMLERLNTPIYSRPTRYFALILPILPCIQLAGLGRLDDLSVFQLLAAGTFYGIACAQFQWKWLGYASGVIYNVALWVSWSRLGWRFAEHPQYYLVPSGLSTILFAEVNRRDLDRQSVNAIRGVGLMLVYVSLAVPVWQFASFVPWLILLFCSLAGVFAGIGMRVQTFLWMGLTTFLLDVLYQLGRVSVDHALAKWAIMLALGLSLIVFVALNEKKRIVATMREYYVHVRAWE